MSPLFYSKSFSLEDFLVKIPKIYLAFQNFKDKLK